MRDSAESPTTAERRSALVLGIGSFRALHSRSFPLVSRLGFSAGFNYFWGSLVCRFPVDLGVAQPIELVCCT